MFFWRKGIFFERKNMNINPEVFGFIAGGISSALFIPQIVKIFKEKSAEEISLLTCIIGESSAVCFGCIMEW